jgi:PIN domain nuclease of toxin-antitoxin system
VGSPPSEIGALLAASFAALDTHVVVRWLIEAKRLTREQVQALERAVRRTEPVAFSAISLLEISILTSERKLRLPLSDFLDELQANPLFRVLPLTYEVAAEVASLGGSLRDPAGRAIVATASVHRLRLVTSDQRIESKLVPVVE